MFLHWNYITLKTFVYRFLCKIDKHIGIDLCWVFLLVVLGRNLNSATLNWRYFKNIFENQDGNAL